MPVLGNYPNEETLPWSHEAQGGTHDRDNWFITQKEHIWRIPVAYDLTSVTLSNTGVKRIGLSDVPQLTGAGYNHFGDLEYYEFEGRGYLLIPIEDADHEPRIPCNGVAVFKADTLEYLALKCLPEQREAPWIAVDPQGNLYSSSCSGSSQ